MEIYLPVILIGSGAAAWYMGTIVKSRKNVGLMTTIPEYTQRNETGGFRHITFDTPKDYLMHPDYRHNMDKIDHVFVDRGMFGQRQYNAHIHPGANITQFYRSSNILQ